MARNPVEWLHTLPLAPGLSEFFVAPVEMIVVASVWGATEFSIYPAVQFDNYRFRFSAVVSCMVFSASFNAKRFTLGRKDVPGPMRQSIPILVTLVSTTPEILAANSRSDRAREQQI